MYWLKQAISRFMTLNFLTLIVITLSLCTYIFQSYINWLQLSVLRDQEQRQLRAYVAVSDMAVDHFTTNEVLTIQLHNFGQTPALNARWVVAMSLLPFSETHTYGLGMSNLKDDVNVTNVYPQVVLPIHKVFTFVPNDIEQWKAQKIDLVVYGVIYYSDIFAKTHRHNFCYFFNELNFSMAVEHPEVKNGGQCANFNEDYDD